MNNYTKSMFETIKDSLENHKQGSGNFKNILSTKPGNSYLMRFIPNVKNPSATFFHYFHHGWTSVVTGQFVNGGLCPRMFDERCPICEHRMKLWQGSEEDKKKAREIGQKENWLGNVYIINDPTNADNNGNIKVLRYGKQVKKILDDAMKGEDAEEFGPAIFDLSEAGCNFRLKVEKNEGDYPTFVSSKFLSKGPIDGLTAEKIVEIQNNIFDLTNFFETKSYAELSTLLSEHFLGNKPSSASAPAPKKEEIKPVISSTVTITEEKKPETPVAPAVATPAATATSAAPSIKEKMDELLAGL